MSRYQSRPSDPVIEVADAVGWKSDLYAINRSGTPNGFIAD